jgi:putative phage-type endonuclease
MAEAARALPYETIGNSNDSDWLERRRVGIGASEISAVLGVSKWQSALTLYYEKTGEEIQTEPEEPIEYLEWGKLLEDKILGELARRADVTVASVQPLLRSAVYPWALATPDGMTADGEPIEAKNIAWGYDEDEWAEQIPEAYYLQTHHQMLVTGADRCLFGALLWGSRMIWEWVPRDEVTIRRIIAGGEAFWKRVQERRPPPSDGHPRARKSLGRLALVPHPTELYEGNLTPEGRTTGDVLHAWRAAQSDYERIKKEEKRAKRQRDAAADEVAKLLGKNREGFTNSGWSIHWKTINRRGYEVAPTSYEQLKITPPKD